MPKTKIIKVDPSLPSQASLKEAAEIIRKGGLVIMPTETVYGIAANMYDARAIKNLSEIKKRPQDKLFSLAIDKKQKLELYATDVPIAAYKLMDRYWPGPLTLVLKCKDEKLSVKPGDRDDFFTIGIRMPDCETALDIIHFAQVPVACPSSNVSGKPAPVTFEEAIADLRGVVDCAIDAGPTKLKRESSVVDVTGGTIRIIRQGAIPEKDIIDTAQRKTVLFICTGNSCRSVMAEALLKHGLKEKKRPDVEVISAGIMMSGGMGASEMTQEILSREGIDVSGHRSRPLSIDMIKKSDIILVMETLHEQRIMQSFPEAGNRVFLLKEFARIQDPDMEIPDPMGRPFEVYEHVFNVIREAVERVMNVL